MNFIIDKKKELTKLPKVMRASIHLFVDKGIDGTTIKDIAKAAGVAEGALYRHFRSKEELAWHLFSTHLNQFTVELMGKALEENDPRKRVEIFVRECFTAFEEDRDLFTYLILSEHQELKRFPIDYKHPGHVVLKIIEEGQKTGHIRSMDPYILGSLVLGGIIRICVTRMYGSITNDLREHIAEVTEALWTLLKV